MELSFSYTDCYWKYIQSYCPEHDNDLAAHLKKTIEATDWESPKAALDWNNLAVAALIEGEQCSDLTMRGLYIETALEALNNGVQLGHPLCAAHLALVLILTGQTEQAMQIAFSNFY